MRICFTTSFSILSVNNKNSGSRKVAYTKVQAKVIEEARNLIDVHRKSCATKTEIMRAIKTLIKIEVQPTLINAQRFRCHDCSK